MESPTLLARQRSFSEGNISPSSEHFEKDSREHVYDKSRIHMMPKNKSFLVRDKLDSAKALLPGELFCARKGLRIVPLDEIMKLTPSVPATSQELGAIVHRKSTEKLLQEARTAAEESEARALKEVPLLRQMLKEEKEKEVSAQQVQVEVRGEHKVLFVQGIGGEEGRVVQELEVDRAVHRARGVVEVGAHGHGDGGLAVPDLQGGLVPGVDRGAAVHALQAAEVLGHGGLRRQRGRAVWPW